MSDTIQEQTPIKQSLQDRLRSMATWDIDCNDMTLVGRVLNEAADEIDRLRRELAEAKKEASGNRKWALGERVEADKFFRRIEQLTQALEEAPLRTQELERLRGVSTVPRKRRVIGRLRAEAEAMERERDEARTKYDESLEERDAILEENRKFRSEIAEANAAKKILGESNYDLCEKIIEKDKLIEELETDIAVKDSMLQGEGHIITTDEIAAEGCLSVSYDAINKAWEYYRGNAMVESAFACLGIVACPKCGGAKVAPVGGDEGTTRYECDCPNNGWVIE